MAEPRVSGADESVEIVSAVPITETGGKVSGVLVAVNDVAILNDIITRTSFLNSGYGYMIDKEGTVIAHPKVEMVVDGYNPFDEVKKDESLMPLVEMVRKMVKGEKGAGEYLWSDGTYKIMGYAPVPGTDWSLAVTVPKKDAMGAVYQLRNCSIILVLVLVLLGIGAAFLLGRNIARPIEAASRFSAAIAGGDLTASIPEYLLHNRDETGTMVRELDRMVKGLRQIIGDIIKNAQEVAASGQELAASAQNISANMEETSASVEEISSSMQEVSASAEEINASGEEMVNKLAVVNDEAKNSYDKVAEIMKRASYTRNEAEKALQNTQQLYGEIKPKIEQAIESAKIIERINSLAQDIASIADQTNLLSLNAAIEAARVGEHGRGFAVVAEEIRKLAENSAAAVDGIHELTKQVQDSVEGLVSNSEAMLKYIDEVVINDYGRTATAGKYYESDANMVNDLTVKTMENINSALESMEEVSRALEATSATIQEVTAGASEIAKTTEMVTGSAVDISRASAGLAQNADVLAQIANRFKL